MELTDKDKQLIREFSRYMVDFADKAVLKFIKGRMEHHGENPMKIDCDYEIMQELADVCSYHFLKTKQNV
jgi:hypothetical protein